MVWRASIVQEPKKGTRLSGVAAKMDEQWKGDGPTMKDYEFSGYLAAGSGRNRFRERQARKTQKKNLDSVFFRIVLLVFSLAVLISCGGGGGGGGTSSNQHQSSNWDTMVWDQDNWR